MTTSAEGNSEKDIETFSTIDWMTSCLLDFDRTSKIISVIERSVGPEDVVLDVGTGSGIFAMAAARAGAKKVVAAEIDSFVASLAQKNVNDNHLEGVVQVLETDARADAYEGLAPFSVVIMEMLTTGMIDEHQVSAMNNLHAKGVVNAKTRFLPARQDTFVMLTFKDFSAYGFEMRMPRHLWRWLPDERPIEYSDREPLSSISFAQQNSLTFSKEVTFTATRDGVVNSIYITSEAVFDEKTIVGETLALNSPVVYPLPEDITVKEGDSITLRIAYNFGEGYQSFKVEKL